MISALAGAVLSQVAGFVGWIACCAANASLLALAVREATPLTHPGPAAATLRLGRLFVAFFAASVVCTILVVFL